jgi:putative ABC transport system substrate-binding protein
MRKFSIDCVISVFLCMFAATGQGIAQGKVSETSQRIQQIHMVVWRGCEEACRGFVRYFEDRELPVNVTVTNVDRDKSKLPVIQKQLIAEAPDLVVTWGTSVSRAILGTIESNGTASELGNIPAIFMIVADPVGSKLVDSYNASGRPLISGVRNRVPEDVQLRLLFEYFRPEKMGVVNDPSELNSTLNTNSLRAISEELSFELVDHVYELDDAGEISIDQIPLALAHLKQRGADAIYVGSSSFNLEHREAFVKAASALGLPVFSAYTQMVKDAGALMAVGTSYTNVGRLAAVQAEQVVLNGAIPGELRIKSLNRYSVILNMTTARELSLYPPLSLLTVAEIVR